MGIDKIISLKEKLKKGKFVLGTWCEIPSSELVNVLGKAGLDFVILDMEHGPMSFTDCSRMVLAAEVEGCSSLIRVSRNDESDILRVLETAPQGVVVPHIETLEDREMAIKHIKFWPAGSRSLNPYTRAGGYRVVPDFTKSQNKNLLTCLIIEGESGIANIETIIDSPDVDIVYVGTYDISLSLGVPGDTKNPKVLRTLEKLIEVILRKKKIAGTMFHDESELKYLKKIGVKLLCYKVDTGVIFDAFNKVAKF